MFVYNGSNEESLLYIFGEEIFVFIVFLLSIAVEIDHIYFAF